MKKKVLILGIACGALVACQSLSKINPRETLDAFVAPFNVVKGAGDILSKLDIPIHDKDEDGHLNFDEFSAAMMDSQRYRLRAAEADMTTEKYITADFDAIDQNDDQLISQDEYAEFREWHYQNTRRRFVEGEI